MKTNRNTYHYKLRKLKRRKQSKIKDSISRCMLRSNKRNYWRSACAVRKNNYNSTLTVDGIHGTSEIANHFKTKFSGLYSVVVVVVCLFIRFLSVGQSSRSGSR